MSRVLTKCKTQIYTLIAKRVTSYKSKLVGLKSWASWCLRWERICLQCRRPGFDPWIEKIPWRRAWQPTPVFLPGESHGQRSLVGYSPWGCKELHTTEWLTHTHTLKSYCSVQRGLVKTQNADPTTPYGFVWNDSFMDELRRGAERQRVDCAGPHWLALTIWTLSHSGR